MIPTPPPGLIDVDGTILEGFAYAQDVLLPIVAVVFAFGFGLAIAIDWIVPGIVNAFRMFAGMRQYQESDADIRSADERDSSDKDWD